MDLFCEYDFFFFGKEPPEEHPEEHPERADRATADAQRGINRRLEGVWLNVGFGISPSNED